MGSGSGGLGQCAFKVRRGSLEFMEGVFEVVRGCL